MGQQANSDRHAELDEHKERAAGRTGRTGQNAPGRQDILDAGKPVLMKGQTAGASGEGRGAKRKGRGSASQRG